MAEEKHLSDCELIVMRIIWGSDEPLTMQEITEKVNRRYHREWQTQTVSTFLHRMVSKDFLTKRRRGRVFYYHPLVTEEEYGQQEIGKCVDDWADSRADLFLAAFLRERTLSDEEKERIRRMIDAME